MPKDKPAPDPGLDRSEWEYRKSGASDKRMLRMIETAIRAGTPLGRYWAQRIKGPARSALVAALKRRKIG